jgi:hypothetical protein
MRRAAADVPSFQQVPDELQADRQSFQENHTAREIAGSPTAHV